jgi:hypothetical protein
MTTLRRRLFVAVLAAIVVAVASTVAIGAALARRTADHNLRVSLAQQANLLATEEQQPSYLPADYVVGDVRVIVKRRADMAQYVPTGKSSNGTLTLEGVRDIYSYRPIGPRGLLMLEPASRPPGVGLVPPRPLTRRRRRRDSRRSDLLGAGALDRDPDRPGRESKSRARRGIVTRAAPDRRNG